ncbi:hypothetical protein SADO_03890 [Salinisphaera dokdonensis CL-ES53]|uniref:DUF4145 domain-containing protein n=1 Tax=Salinisphaera dokdonensis CL-ES53 TaxID=1304272 RepID=A0ABV2AXN0_9GAMM
MEWKELAASAIGSLAWPISIFVMFFLVRGRISELIEKLGRLKYKDLELDFSKLKHPKPIIDASSRTLGRDEGVAIKDSESEQVFSSLEDQIFEAVEDAPAASVLLAWSYVEASLTAAISRLEFGAEAPSGSPLQNIKILESTGELSPQQLELLHDLRILRNKLAHGGSSTKRIRTEQAYDYATTAVEISRFLDSLERKRKIFMLPVGKWIKTPEGFSEQPKDRLANYWRYDCITLPGKNITAGSGPWIRGSDIVYFGIDIEMQRNRGSAVVAELLIGLEYVAQEKLKASANEIVSYDEMTHTIRFDLGKSIFEYQFE